MIDCYTFKTNYNKPNVIDTYMTGVYPSFHTLKPSKIYGNKDNLKELFSTYYKLYIPKGCIKSNYSFICQCCNNKINKGDIITEVYDDNYDGIILRPRKTSNGIKYTPKLVNKFIHLKCADDYNRTNFWSTNYISTKVFYNLDIIEYINNKQVCLNSIIGETKLFNYLNNEYDGIVFYNITNSNPYGSSINNSLTNWVSNILLDDKVYSLNININDIHDILFIKCGLLVDFIIILKKHNSINYNLLSSWKLNTINLVNWASIYYIELSTYNYVNINNGANDLGYYDEESILPDSDDEDHPDYDW